jgi:S-adenosylmethionine:tRNA ribosyltransferase-isomerase
LRNSTSDFIPFEIEQDYPYKVTGELPLAGVALEAILEMMKKNNLNEIVGHTSIFIHQGYSFRICNGLITNFHLPCSKLILLVAALIGSDWKRVYDSALENNYRFLSYGDSSLLIP